MLYNLHKKRVKTQSDCLTCEYFDRDLLKCNGLGKRCFEYDEKTKTVIDTTTKLPMKVD